ncbi:MAG: EF-P lysine aminoacylase GenX [Kiritimatiellae bacterium]|nr:EF-P lysine aminoacylase GenX [Kiritimatiellia bacterium]
MKLLNVDLLKRRAKILAGIRTFFDSRGFIEVETPVRIAAPAPEVNIDCPEVPPSRIHGGETSYLRASPELQMKKLLAAGMDRIYQIGPCFRDGEKGSRHNPEFTMIEWYRKGATYLDILEDTKRLYSFLSEICGDRPFVDGCGDRPFVENGMFDGENLVFKEITVRDAYLSWAGWDPWADWNQDRFDFDMATKIEPALKSLGLVFLMDYPPQAASLAKIRGDVAERWEFYSDGIELANCFTELCDPVEQRRRFLESKEERRQLGESDYPIDEEFLAVLGDMKSAAGVALGVDRLVMKLVSADEIAHVRCVD